MDSINAPVVRKGLLGSFVGTFWRPVLDLLRVLGFDLVSFCSGYLFSLTSIRGVPTLSSKAGEATTGGHMQDIRDIRDIWDPRMHFALSRDSLQGIAVALGEAGAKVFAAWPQRWVTPGLWSEGLAL